MDGYFSFGGRNLTHCEIVKIVNYAVQTLNINIKKTPKNMASLQAEYKKGYKKALEEVKKEVNGLANALRSRCNPNPLGSIKECLADAEIQTIDLVLEIIDKKNK